MRISVTKLPVRLRSFRRASRTVRQGAVSSSTLPSYAALVVSLAVFLVVMVIVRAPAEYLVSVEVASLESGEMPVMSLSPTEIARGARLAALGPITADGVRNIGRRLGVRPLGRRGSICWWEVSYRGQDRDASLVFIEHVTRQICRTRPQTRTAGPDVAAQMRAARWRYEQARHYERKALFDLEELVHADGDLPGRELDLADAALAADASGGESSGAAQAVRQTPQLNPAWEETQDALTRLTQELGSLLQVLTPNHPRVRNVSLQMEHLQRKLSETSRYLQESPQPVMAAMNVASDGGQVGWENSSPDEYARQASGVSEDSMPRGLGTERDQRQADYQLASEQREEAERTLIELMTLRQLAAEERAAEVPRHISSIPSVRLVAGRPAPVVVGTVGLLALLCGAVTYWSARSAGDLRLNTLSEVRTVSGLPVVAYLGIDSAGGRRDRRASWHRVLSGVTRLSELVLLLLLALYVWSLLQAGPYGQELRENPFGSLAQRVAEVSGR